MKKVTAALIVLLMAAAMIFTGCNHVSPQIEDGAEGETTTFSDSSSEIGIRDNESPPVITDAKILIVESKFMSSGIGTEKVSMPELLSTKASGSETLFYYSLLRTFSTCEQIGDTLTSLTFAGETFDVTYARSEKLNYVPDEMISIYDKYDVYFDEYGVEYHVRADGQVVFMFPSIDSTRYIGSGDTAVEAAEEVLKKVLGDNADNYELYAHGNYDTYQCVEFHYQKNLYDTADKIIMLLTKDNEVYSFSAYNLGRFDNVSALSATEISGYTSYLKTVLSDSGIKNVPLKDAVLFEYGGQYYVMHELAGESVTVNGMQKHVDPAFFYVRIEAAESK